jgi:anthranilate synthase/aminodeoxychorismate synthase-like glutamine amidotransferase
MWILLDNYDSFTYILHHYLLQTGYECTVLRNDEVSVEQLIKLNPARLIISPGPETPLQAGICMEAIAHFHNRIPILGVCLGHQALGMFFGAQLVHAPSPMHGKTSEVIHNGHQLFESVPSPCTVMRYHSLAIEKLDGTDLQTIASSTDDNTIMAMVHNIYPCTGIQFHPESVGTSSGLEMLRNWSHMYR